MGDKSPQPKRDEKSRKQADDLADKMAEQNKAYEQDKKLPEENS